MLVHLAEYFVVMVNGVDRALFTYLIDLHGRLDTGDWMSIIVFTIVPAVGFYSLFGLGLLQYLKERQLRLLVLAFALLVVAALPILIFRRGFVPRMGYLQVFSFTLALGLGYWGSEKCRRYFLAAALIILLVQFYSFAKLLNDTGVVSSARSNFISYVAAADTPAVGRPIGLSPYSYRDLPVLYAPEEELAWRAGVRASSSGLGLRVFREVGSAGLNGQVACTQTGASSFRYATLYTWAYVTTRETDEIPDYVIGQSRTGTNGFRFVVLGTNARGYITDLELLVPDGGQVTDCGYWRRASEVDYLDQK
ncbi:MAG: hypothetical protein HY675_06555 [Chloroflexi bacterium]|nr:hypothetical protein [Chloroflexota bacterium]